MPKVQQLQLLRSKELAVYNKAVRPLSDAQTVALHLIGNDIHPLDYAAALRKLQQNGETVNPTMFKVLDDPKVVAAFEHPDPQLVRAVDAADALTQLDAKVRGAHGQLTPETAAARVAKHRQSVADILAGPPEAELRAQLESWMPAGRSSFCS